MELWTKEHALTLLPAVALMIAVSLILRHCLKDRPYKIRLIPFQILSAVLFAAEIGKQVISFSCGYDLYHIPLHFCSLFIFMMPLMSLYKGKYAQGVRAVTSALCASVFLLMMIYPNLIYSASNIRDFFTEYMSFHTVLFHNIVVFAFILIVTLDLYTPQGKHEWKYLQVFYIAYCAVSAIMAQILKTNYNNFYKCNVPPLEQVRQMMQGVIGYGMTQVLYVLIVTFVQSLFVQGAFWLCKFCLRCLQKKETAHL